MTVWTPTPWTPKKDKAAAETLVAQLTDEQLMILARRDDVSLGREIHAARRLINRRRQQES